MGQWFSSEVEVDMDGDHASQVKAAIENNSVVVYSKSYCPYCTSTKKLLKSLDQQFTLIELDQTDDGSIIQTILGKMTGASTVPRIFIKGKCIGGNSDLQQLHKEGKLTALLAA